MGLSAESGPGKDKQSTGEMVYNHTGFKKAVDWVSSLFTPAAPQKLLRFTKDVGTVLYMKKGGGEVDKTKGSAKEWTNIDGIGDVGGGVKNGNKYSKAKDFVSLIGDLIGGYQAGEVATEKVEEEYKIIVSKGKEIKQEVGFENGKVISVKEKSKDVIFTGTQSKVEKQQDSLNKANETRRESTKVLTR